MSALPKDPWTAAQYHAFERDSAFKHEFINGEVVAMTSASRRHNLIVTSTTATLYNQTVDRPCEVYPSDMRVHVPATNLYAYPDVSATCSQPEMQDHHFDTLLNPMVK